MLRNVTCKTSPVKRSAGQSAVTGAAYRAGERLQDERTGKVADFSRRGPEVRETLILAPSSAPDWCLDRQQLWNAAEAAEKRKDGRPARDVILGLAWELPPEEQRAIVAEFAEAEFVSKGHVVDIAIHNYGQRVTDLTDEGRETIRRWASHDVPFLEADECAGLYEPHVKIDRDRAGNVTGYKIYQPHAHCYVTPRAIEGDGFASKRNRTFDRAEQAMEWRYEWPKFQNHALEQLGLEVRVSATETEGDIAVPERRPEHVEQAVWHMEQRGEETTLGEQAEMNAMHNEAIAQGFADLHSASDPETEERQNEARLAAWWRNLEQSYQDLKERAHEKAQEWRQRFAMQAERLRSWFGQRAEHEPDPDDAAAGGAPQVGPDQQTGPEPPEMEPER